MTDLLVYEAIPLNAAEFARLADVRLREVRSLTQLRQAIEGAENPSSLVVAIEVTQKSLVDVVTLVHSLQRRARKQSAGSGRPAVIAMPDSTVQFGTHALYEVGTDLVFRSMLDRNMVASLIRAKNRANTSDNRPRELTADNPGQELPQDDLRAKVWSRMPWKRMATGGSR